MQAVTIRRGQVLALSAATLLTAVFAATAGAQSTSAAALPVAGLPSARALVEKYVEASGMAVLRNQQSMHTSGTFSMPAMGATGKLELFQLAPNRMAMRMNLPGLGDLRSGFDGETAWSMNPMEGPRLMAGDELRQIRDEADFLASLRDAKLIASVETVEKTEIEGRACWKVRLTWKSGRESFDCYDTESGLLHATMQKNVTAMGTLESLTVFTEYRDFDGVKMPTVTTQQVFGQLLVMKTESVRMGGVDEAVVELPAEIRALVAK
jgi:hypothetical protein